MGNTGEDVDTSPMKMEKKKMKKSKNKTNNLPDVVDDGGNNGNNHLEEINDDGLSKEKKHKHMKKKKKKSESKEDEDASTIKMEKKKKKKSKNKTNNLSDDNNDDGNGNTHVEEFDDDGVSKEKEHKHMKKKKKKSELNGVLEKKNEKKRKRDSSEEDPKPKIHKKKKNLETNSEKPKSKKKPKKVAFSNDVEIFPSPNTKNPQKTKSDNHHLVRGKRFTPEEDEIVKQAVNDYITTNNLGDDGLHMILNCRSHLGLKHCWQEIGTCIPYRPNTAIYCRAHILFEQSEHRQWTPGEIQLLKESHKKHGNKWKMIAEELGKYRAHVRDTWRRIKFDNLKAGKWSQDEYQDLYDLVNLDLQMKINEQEKKSKHGMLRDNIPWTAISEKLSTRSDATCCTKWYRQLTSSLVEEKKWLDSDDYWLVGRLYEIDATCVEDVDWDGVLEHRSGEVCRKRWDQMVVCIGNHKSKTFGEQVEILAKRYRPELAEVRQTWDDKPRVP